MWERAWIVQNTSIILQLGGVLNLKAAGTVSAVARVPVASVDVTCTDRLGDRAMVKAADLLLDQSPVELSQRPPFPLDGHVMSTSVDSEPGVMSAPWSGMHIHSYRLKCIRIGSRRVQMPHCLRVLDQLGPTHCLPISEACNDTCNS